MRGRGGLAWFGTVVLCAATLGTAPGMRNLEGRFVWSGGGDEGDLAATFTPAGEGRWDVEFFFTFGGTPHVYSGSAEGSLGSGALAGEVKSDGRNRTFTFEGRFADGVFEGTHAEITGGGAQPTGTLTLRE